MTNHRVIHVLALGAAIGVGALAQTPVASAAVLPKAFAAEETSSSLSNCITFDVYAQPVCGVPGKTGPKGRTGPRGRTGARGPRGYRGFPGLLGPAGATGATGATGASGPTGATGATGATGSQGIQGIAGLPNGTEVVDGNLAQFSYSGGPTVTGDPTTSVADCPVTGTDAQAYGGGAQITTNDQNAKDVVTLQSSFPGTANGGSVTPVTGADSPANAWQATSVISSLASGDTGTTQAYVICGPA